MPSAPLVFFWENFGPMHVDRVEAVAAAFPERAVIGVELRDRSAEYSWDSPTTTTFHKRTLFPAGREPGFSGRLQRMLGAFGQIGRGNFFLCHYDWPEVLAAAGLLRAARNNVVAMGCSKFDDKPRRALRETAKSLALSPYCGAIGSGRRSADYFRFLGIRPDRVSTEYNTLSIARLREQADTVPAPGGVPFGRRHFVAVARLVAKKNLATLIEGYARYRAGAEAPRELHICGDGPLEGQLQEQVAALGLADQVVFRGFLQSGEISEVLGQSLALLLPSIEEQFGNVVIEAQALGLPVILSDNCGARDRLVRNGVNGFVVEPDNVEGLAYFMHLLADDEALWRRMASQASQSAEAGDVGRFVDAVREQCRL